jgi:hypothetical protein
MSLDYNRRAKLAGAFLIVATVASLLSAPFPKSINTTDYLEQISMHVNQVSVGVLLGLIAATAVAGIVITLYPVLRKYHESAALAALSFRLIEATFFIVSVTILLSLVTVSQDFAKAGASSAAYYQAIGAMLLSSYHWVGDISMLTAFCLGALAYYYIFYQTKLVPRWLSVWGFVGVASLMTATLLILFHVIAQASAYQTLLAMPIFAQEMVLAVWLLWKGFDPSVLATHTSRVAKQSSR